MIKLYSPGRMLLGLGEILTPVVDRVYLTIRGLGIVRAVAGAASLLKNPSQVFPENKFHDGNETKQNYF